MVKIEAYGLGFEGADMLVWPFRVLWLGPGAGACGLGPLGREAAQVSLKIGKKFWRWWGDMLKWPDRAFWQAWVAGCTGSFPRALPLGFVQGSGKVGSPAR